jgi:D-3-phosphoglycerate dehydrogenase
LAMEGRISFEESLAQRVVLLGAHKKHLLMLIQILKKRISTSFSRNKAFFKTHADSVYIVSGGFKEFIIPVLRPFHILESNIFANTFEFDSRGLITGLDKTNPLCKEGGKVLLLKQWNLEGNVFGIGDGYSDYQLKESGLIQKFFAFTENIIREKVTQKADHIIPSFDEFLYINNLPRAISYPKNRILSLLIGEYSENLVDIFKKDGLSVRVKTSFEEKYQKDVGLLVLDHNQKLEESILKKAVKLKVIGILDHHPESHISLDVCTKMGIVVFSLSSKKMISEEHEYAQILRKMISYINKGSTKGSLNFPNLEMKVMKGAHRLLHIHHNVPGIIAKINQVMAKHKLNIEGQYLKTNSQLGYVITDVNSKYDKAVLADLRQIDHTLKFRVLY